MQFTLIFIILTLACIISSLYLCIFETIDKGREITKRFMWIIMTVSVIILVILGFGFMFGIIQIDPLPENIRIFILHLCGQI